MAPVVHQSERSPARCDLPGWRERRSCRADPNSRFRWRGFFLFARNDGDPLVETFAARLGADFSVVLQRQVYDASLDRTHRLEHFLTTFATHSIRHRASALNQLIGPLLLEAAAVQLNGLLQFSAS